jgi:hypothetical protein
VCTTHWDIKPDVLDTHCHNQYGIYAARDFSDPKIKLITNLFVHLDENKPFTA